MVSHGLTIRLLVMRYFSIICILFQRYLRLSVADFELLWNLGNAEAIVLQSIGEGKYRLATPISRLPSSTLYAAFAGTGGPNEPSTTC